MNRNRKSCRQQNIPKRTMKRNEGALRPRMAAALLLMLFGRIRRWEQLPKQLNNQQRRQHRRLGKAHGARDDLVEASCVSFASVQARKLNHYAASTLPTKPSGFAGSPRRASEKRAVGSLGRLHHAAQPVWTHNVRPAHKTGCRGWGCKQSRPLPRAVRAAKLCPRCSPSPGRELQIRQKRKP